MDLRAFVRLRPYLVVPLTLLTASAGLCAGPPGPGVGPVPLPAAPGEILVRFDGRLAPGARRAALDRAGARFKRSGYRNAFQVLSVPPGNSVDTAISRLRRTPGVQSAEPNYYLYASANVNDPYFRPYQWNFFDTGFGIRAETAWNFSNGGGIVVAVIDTGVAYENYGTLTAAPDLSGTGFVPGFDFVDSDTHPQDENGHGTHVTGVLAQSTNNGQGCAGLAHGAAIMPIRVLDKDGRGTMDQVANGIRWAVDNGARVINVSLGGPAGTTALAEAVRYAASRDVLVVTAAGNSGISFVDYPAMYPQTIAVGGTRFDGQLASYSNFGPELDVVAPGGDLTVDQNGDGYPDGILQEMPVPGAVTFFNLYFMAGTSMATPHVSGIAALVRSRFPNWSAAQVREAIEATCRDLGPAGKDSSYGYGLVDAAAAVQYVPADRTPPTAPTDLRVTSVTPDAVGLAWGPSTDNAALVGYRIYRDGGYLVALTGTSHMDMGLTSGRTYRFFVVAFDLTGNVSASSNEVTVTLPGGLPPDTTPPTPPSGLVVTELAHDAVGIAWTAAADDRGVVRYDIFRDGAAAGSTNGTSYRDGGRAGSTSYRYTVVAWDAAGNASAESAPLFVTTPAPPPPPDSAFFNFEDGSLQGWVSMSSRAALSNSPSFAFGGQRSLRALLSGVSSRSRASLAVTLPVLASAPRAGSTLHGRIYLPRSASLQVRLVAYDASYRTFYGAWSTLAAGNWTEFAAGVPSNATGTIKRIDIQISGGLGSYSGDLFLDSIGW